jgi:hypothetical protein
MADAPCLSVVRCASALLLVVLLALPFVGCGGGSPGTPGGTGGGGTGSAAACSPFCRSALACKVASGCILADPSGAASACAASCDRAFAELTSAEADLVEACVTCRANAASGGCFDDLPSSACASACDTVAASEAQTKWTLAMQSQPVTSAGLCTNGMSVLSAGCGTMVTSDPVGGTPDTCTQICCNSPSCAAPDVAAHCSGPSGGPAACTCTAGKSQGKAFSWPNAMSCSTIDVWSECNL